MSDSNSVATDRSSPSPPPPIQNIVGVCARIHPPKVRVDYIDMIITDLGGIFNRFHVINYALFGFTLALSGAFGLSYVFTAFDIDYRCRIPECELSNSSAYEPSWLLFAVPYNDAKPSKCDRYVHRQVNNETMNNTCTKFDFDHSRIDRCHDFVYAENDSSILTEFGLQCEENRNKLTMVGTANTIGRLLFTPIMGYLSDRYGRRTILIVGILGSTMFAIMRSYATDYTTFVALEFADAAIGSCIYSASFLLAMEWVGRGDRVLLSTIVTGMYPFGQLFLGVAAKYAGDFRLLLQIVYAPGLLAILYFWIAPESIRWMVLHLKGDEVIATLKRAEAINNVKIRSETWQTIDVEYEATPNRNASILFIRTKRIFVIRFIICAFAWFSCSFISYGISLTSTTLLGHDQYISFVMVAMAGIPAMPMCFFLAESFGRRWTIASSVMACGGAIFLAKLMPSDYIILPAGFYFIGKCFSAVSFTALYIYTGEMWPTSMRHSVMSTCSMFGRIGAALATLIPIMSYYWTMLPYTLFFVMAAVTACFILRLPETWGSYLPDNLKQAEYIHTVPDIPSTD